MHINGKNGKNSVIGIFLAGMVLVVVTLGGFWFFGTSNNKDLPSVLRNDNSTVMAVGSPTSTPGLYHDASIGFSFKYPLDASLEPTAQDDSGNGTTLLVKAKNGPEVQVTLLPFDENISLTAARIKQDIPTIVMNNTRILPEGSVSDVAVQAVYFETATTREVWFVTGGHLYQVSGLLSDTGDLFDSVSKSFSFN